MRIIPCSWDASGWKRAHRHALRCSSGVWTAGRRAIAQPSGISESIPHAAASWLPLSPHTLIHDWDDTHTLISQQKCLLFIVIVLTWQHLFHVNCATMQPQTAKRWVELLSLTKLAFCTKVHNKNPLTFWFLCFYVIILAMHHHFYLIKMPSSVSIQQKKIKVK